MSVRTVAVRGGGHGALAAVGDLALRGYEVRLALLNRERFAGSSRRSGCASL